MDKSWIGNPMNTNEYLLGLDEFLELAFNNSAAGDTIRCPCPKCGFSKWKTRDIVHDHLICKPFPQNYVIWDLHGEKRVTEAAESSQNINVMQETFYPEDPIETMIHDAFGHHTYQAADVEISQPLGEDEISNEEHRDDPSDSYEFPKDGNETLYEGSKYTKLEFVIKLYHIKVLCRLSDKALTMILDLLRDAFENAKLPPSFYEAKKIINKLGLDYTKIPACPNNCMLYWEGDSELEACKYCGTSKWDPKNKKKQAAKVLRYFPLKPRLQRLYMCRKTAEHMRWNASGSNNNGLIRHPMDGEAWRTFDLTHSEFASDSRNVRLGLASDGFNPFGTMSTTYSIWPVFLIPYNLPPWMCMKHTSFILSMIIPGILSGWNTHTGFACPTCNFDTEPCRLRHSKKWCFMVYRRFLKRNHRFRLNRVRFNGSTEERNPPLKLSRTDILRQIEEGRGVELNGSGKRSRRATKQWNKRSIFFELPYWESNLLYHNLDFMHIEKNVCDNIIYTLLHDKSKSKDYINARKDLKEMGIKRDLWPDDNGTYHLAVFSLMPPTRDNKCDTRKLFLTTLKNVVVPDGYSILVEFCSFFRALSSKSLNLSDLDKLQERIELTLCHLEILFPPSFFTVMVHLTVHLVQEAKLGGPVHYRHMYPVERELGHFKSFVRNKAQAEASIAEGYLAEETLTFCSRYMEDIETRFNRPRCVRDDPNVTEPSEMSSIFPQLGKPGSASENFPFNTYAETTSSSICASEFEFRQSIRRSSRGRRPSPIEIERRVNKDFVDWFLRRIVNPDIMDTMSTDLKFLARGPSVNARRFTSYNINGVDRNLQQADLPYYGKLEDIIEINYNGRFKVVLFKCKWADTTRERGYKKDRWSFNCINFDRLIHTGEREEHEPYIEVSQTQMVYYVDDVVNKGWSVVVHLKPKDLYEMGEEVVEDEVCENEPYQEQELEQFFGHGDEYIQLATDHQINEENIVTNLAADANMSE
ncbi:uncharacterized protein LOC142162942 [Nicotiana tabacum]|uniref:Uncharacterized protein LOC142162942 n=1 Tax=Nicotiana tabacum TaxID=4097 RepID=A0AC58RU71_TOBAC